MDILQQLLKVEGIPSILWGAPSNHLILAVHGNQSHKADTVIAMLARCATAKGYQVLSFDLPAHGDRIDTPTPCNAQVCAAELRTLLAFAQTHALRVSLFGCSLGAYFSLLAFANEPLQQAFFLSPVVDMQCLIENMMQWFSISEQRLQTEKQIPTPLGEILDWDYYCYVKAHPIDRWDVPTAILYGANDNLCPQSTVSNFATRFTCDMTTMPDGEHFFHTPEQLAFYDAWLQQAIKECPL